MGFPKNSLRPALAVFVIAHGLAQAVMPMRGGMDGDERIPAWAGSRSGSTETAGQGSGNSVPSP